MNTIMKGGKETCNNDTEYNVARKMLRLVQSSLKLTGRLVNIGVDNVCDYRGSPNGIGVGR